MGLKYKEMGIGKLVNVLRISTARVKGGTKWGKINATHCKKPSH